MAFSSNPILKFAGIGITAGFFIDCVLGGNVLAAVLFTCAVLAGLAASERAGGLQTVLGIGFFSLLIKYILCGLICKLLVLESWDDRLSTPVTTAAVYCTGFVALLAVAMISRRLIKPSSYGFISAPATAVDNLKLGYILAVVGRAASYIVTYVPSGRGPIIPFSGLAAAGLAHLVFYGIESKHPLRWVHTLLVSGVLFYSGVLGGSKQGMLTPMIVIGLAFYLKYGFRRLRLLIAGAMGIFVAFTVIYPYSQAAKSEGAAGGAGQLELAKEIFNSAEARNSSRESTFASLESSAMNYVGHDVGLLERFMLLKPGDRLIYTTEATGFAGWYPLQMALLNFVPQVFYPGKITFSTGNYLGQLTGVISSEDNGTAIAFTSFATAYYCFGLIGVFVGPFIFYLFFAWFLGRAIGSVTGFDPRVVALFALSDHGLTEDSLGELPLVAFIVCAYFIVVKASDLSGAVRFSRRGTQQGQPPPPRPMPRPRAVPGPVPPLPPKPAPAQVLSRASHPRNQLPRGA